MNRPLVLLSPYRPPTSYPVSLSTDEAAAWLNAYASLWHPLALRGAMMPPSLASAYDHNDPAERAIYALPKGPSLYLADDWRSRAAAVNAVLIDATADRPETFATLKTALKADEEIEPPIVRLFTAVGYAYLMLDTLFDAANHDRLLDLEGFWKDVQNAAEHAHQLDVVRSSLTEAANKLQSAREGLAPDGVTLADLIILEDLAHPWPCPFTTARPVTLLATSSQLQALSEQQPQRMSELQAAIPRDLPASVDLAVGVVLEKADSVLPVESQLWNLRQARNHVHTLLGVLPKLFGRTVSEYHPQTPSWLNSTGFTGMISLNLDGATLPTRYGSLLQWPGPDGKAIIAYTRDPLPAHDPATFFNLAYYLHDARNRESSPSVCLMHTKPAAVGYDDLLALSELAPVFGDWRGLDRLTADSHSAEYVSVSTADEFVRDVLDDRVIRSVPHPLSGFAEHARHRRRLDSAFTLLALHRTLAPNETPPLLKNLADAEVQFESMIDASPIAELETACATKLAERLLSRSEPNKPGWLILNSTGALRRVGLELDATHPIPLDGPVKASDFSNGKATVVVEVPGLGFAWIPRGVPGTVLPKGRMRTADGTTVRNEYVEAEVDAATGAVKAIRDSRLRVTRLGQNLCFGPGSRMVASSVKVTQSNGVLGEVTSVGTIVSDANEPLASFTQRVRAWIGRPALELRIELQPAHPLAGYAWQNYFASRFAWRDDRAALFRSSHGQNTLTRAPRPCSSDYLEVRFGKERSFLFTGGLPFLQTHGKRMVDLLLAVPGETQTHFELLIAFDRDYPMATAQSWLVPPPVLAVDRGPPPVGASGWLAHYDLPSLLLTSMRPVGERSVDLRFHETAGFAAASELRFARDPVSARMVDFNGEQTMPLSLNGDAIPIDCSANELFTVRCDW